MVTNTIGEQLVLYFCLLIIYIMAEDLNIITNANKEEQYQSLIPQLKALIGEETDLIANLANIAAALKEQFKWFWVGFYLVKDNELVLGPFQGPVACTRIKKGKGVCGASWEQEQVLIVPDVDAFPGHIACASASRSEIVLPVFIGEEIVGVLDVDSEYLSHFDEVDSIYLKKIISIINRRTT
jgi:L-methionine (R)-S-oxide reductase